MLSIETAPLGETAHVLSGTEKWHLWLDAGLPLVFAACLCYMGLGPPYKRTSE